MVKRVFDILFSVSLCLFLLPLMLIIALAVRYKLGSPVLFKQERPGLGGRPFVLLKFRSMLDLMDKNGKPLDDAQRLTRFGSLLRSSSLDELPSLLNVVLGDISLVGPRPLLMRYLPLYTKHQFRRHEAKPGITGWAQVNGRNAISWESKFDLDVWYVDNRSLLLDIKILLMTVSRVLRRSDINAQDHASMHEFKGSEEKL